MNILQILPQFLQKTSQGTPANLGDQCHQKVRHISTTPASYAIHSQKLLKKRFQLMVDYQVSAESRLILELLPAWPWSRRLEQQGAVSCTVGAGAGLRQPLPLDGHGHGVGLTAASPSETSGPYFNSPVGPSSNAAAR